MKRSRSIFNVNIYVATIYQWAVALFFLWLTRLIFVCGNASSVDVAGAGDLLRLSCYGLRFDLVAVAYVNSLFVLMRILPFGFTSRRGYVAVTDWIYYVTNSLMLAVSFGDVAYYRFSGTRLRWSGVCEVLADRNAGGIVASYAFDYWWVVLAVVASVAAMVWLYGRVSVRPLATRGPRTVLLRCLLFVVLGGLTFLCMRGRAGSGNPLNIADATWGVRSAPQINVVLNTPFTLIRSIGKGSGVERLTFFSDAELRSLRNSEHPAVAGPMLRKNVMIIIIESGGAVFIDTLNVFDGGRGSLSGLMPFTDSLAAKSLVCTHMLATGRRSNEGANAILGSFPAFEPLSYMLSPYNATPFDSPGSLLKSEGYSTAFYYGCNHGSFNIDQLAHASGLDRVVDRAAYVGADDDYDGTWGIYDVPMAEFTVADLSSLPQPWMTSWFTISAHSPHKMPADADLTGYRYKKPSPQRGLEYTDRALRRFFEKAKSQPWYANTVFVITGDHGNRDMEPGSRYDTPFIRYHVPFIVYAPDGSVAPQRITDRAMSQFDISPTLLSLLNYPRAHVSVGADLLDDTVEHFGLSFIDNRYMISSPHKVVFTDAGCRKVVEVYDAVADPELKHPLAGGESQPDVVSMLRWAQAFLQDYTHRINSGGLTLR